MRYSVTYLTEADEARVKEFDAAVRARWCREYSVLVCRKTFRYLYLVPTADGVEVLTVACRITKGNAWETKIVAWQSPPSTTIYLRSFEYKGITGWVVNWREAKYKAYDDYVLRWEYKSGLAFPYDAVINPGALAETKYKWCGWSPAVRVGLVDYLHLYERDPRIEHLAKAHLYNLICPSGLAALKNDRFFRWCRDHAQEILTTGAGIRELRWAFNHRKSISDAMAHFTALATICRYTIPKACLHRAVQIKAFFDTLDASDISRYEYTRYLSYAEGLGWDVADDRVLFPSLKTFRELLERTEGLMAREEKKRERMKQRERNANIKTVAEKYKCVIPHDSYSVAFPLTSSDLVTEGRKMHNCVGRYGYDLKIASGKSVVFFIRRDGKPYADCEVEMSPTIKMRQLYARHNSKVDPDAEDFAARILCHIKRVSKRNATPAKKEK